ncbi:hypothetical protein BJP36_01810 [Moorena producens JHB]|uniref:Uncharacterized protein n=1 Tax=Moorena producens (strain JHB) TaxID=1454205 RepID=A0A1D9FTU9_MOOP1|nr:hypothetical protein [Moorena producens]AOY78818.2 hypothetical protein BJP36_01810 [Moorena producens JHB]
MALLNNGMILRVLWNGHVGGMGMLVERASCLFLRLSGRQDAGHVGGMGMLVERASCWNGHVGGMGMLVEWACWWNGHVGGMGILPVTILGQAGCPHHSYSSLDSAIALHSAISHWPTADG